MSIRLWHSKLWLSLNNAFVGGSRGQEWQNTHWALKAGGLTLIGCQRQESGLSIHLEFWAWCQRAHGPPSSIELSFPEPIPGSTLTQGLVPTIPTNQMVWGTATYLAAFGGGVRVEPQSFWVMAVSTGEELHQAKWGGRLQVILSLHWPLSSSFHFLSAV